jgi:hypothetical protein
MVVTDDRARLTRRQLLKAGAGLAIVGGSALAGSELFGGGALQRMLGASVSGATGPVRTFRSRPDLSPPALSVAGSTNSRGFVLMDASWGQGNQVGPLIIDNAGEPAWFRPLSNSLALNLNMQHYRGRPVLTWWEGGLSHYYGQGEAVIADHSYRELTRLRAAGARQMDLHEFVLTPDGTALFTCFPRMVTTDLSSIGGASDATVVESVFQEVELRSGRLLHEWRSLDYISPEESYEPLSEPYDYLHLNSIRIAADGNLLVSGRGTWSVYKLDRRSGAVIWRLGGKRSDFAMEQGAQFSFQHHAVPVSRDVISVFDNGSDGTTSPENESRAILVKFDEARRAARLGQSYKPPRSFLAASMGSVHLGDGRVLVGWGTGPYITEYATDGTLLWSAHILSSGAHSYRAFRVPWRGRPNDLPAVWFARDRRTGRGTVYVSWNGATEVRHWQVLAGAERDELSSVGVARRRGFETAIPLGRAGGYVAVRALDATGARLATSRVVKL